MIDKRILEQLFRQNYSEMIHLASVLLGDDEEAEDVVQDVFLRVADSDIPPKNDYYLLTAVRNACLNRIRQMHLHDKVKRLMPLEDDSALQPIDKRMERLDDIATYVDEQLEEPHRSIFHLRFDDDLTMTTTMETTKEREQNQARLSSAEREGARQSQTTNENIRQLMEMLDNPDAYTEQQIQNIINHDEDTRETYRLMVEAKRSSRHRQNKKPVDVDAAWQRFNQKFQPKQSSSNRMKIAASFIGVLLVSGIAFAAIHIVRQYQKQETHRDCGKCDTPRHSTPCRYAYQRYRHSATCHLRQYSIREDAARDSRSLRCESRIC